MNIVHSIADLRTALQGATNTAFVPTMGNLHAGHLSLVQMAREQGAPVVASIFVNRLQFAPHEDFDTYPRTLERDCELLDSVGCDLVFAPSEKDLYPVPQTYKVQPPPALADILEGHFRPGFFTGVCTVVLKLFNAVQPAVAVFGKKDYQQLMVIRHMVSQLALPIEVLGGDTSRAEDGLALSSRNGYLSGDQRSEAVQLSQALRSLITQARQAPAGTALDTLEQAAMAELAGRGWAPDYLTLRRRSDLLPPTDAERAAGEPLVALGAARIGNTRLIDNIEC